jgi:hypothetical protein
MKKVFGFLSLVVVMMLVACGPTQEQAAEYNDQIIDQQIAIVDRIDVLVESYQYYIPADMDKAYNDAVNQVNKGIETVTALDKFDGKTDFKDAALELFNGYKAALENEHKEMVRIYKIPDETFTEEHYQQWDKLAEEADRKMEEAFNKFGKAQDEFAAKYKLELY